MLEGGGAGRKFSVSIGPGPVLGSSNFQSNIASVWSQNIFRIGLSSSVAFALLFLFISCKPHFISATKKEVIDITDSMRWISYVVERLVHVCNIFSLKKSAYSNLMQAYIESLIRFSSTMTKLLMFQNRFQSIYGWTTLSLLKMSQNHAITQFCISSC